MINIINSGGEVMYNSLHWVFDLWSSVSSCFDSDDVKLISGHCNITTNVLQYTLKIAKFFTLSGGGGYQTYPHFILLFFTLSVGGGG